MTLNQMHARLHERFPNAEINVADPYQTGGSKVEITIKEPALKELNRVKQHQAVMAVFQSELTSGEIHALTIKVI